MKKKRSWGKKSPKTNPDLFKVNFDYWHKRCAKNPYAWDKHHRKSRANGGDDNQKNIALVTRLQHQAFNQLFCCGCATADKIVGKLNYYCHFLLPSQRGGTQSNTWCNKASNRIKVEAWQILFDSNALSAIVATLNKTWIDPTYRVEVRNNDGKQTAITRKR